MLANPVSTLLLVLALAGDLPAPSVTQGELTIGGERIAYTATAGHLTIAGPKGKPGAHLFCVSYVRDGVEDVSKRPVTFAFNGGPGSSSVWLHLGALGPRRVRLDAEGMPPPPPYRLVDNAESWLDLTDLVFIDPVTTGYSRAAKGVDPKRYHGLEEDIRSVSEVVRLWTTQNGRWASPKYLVGESYGTVRAAGMAAYLQDAFDMYLNGVVLVSPVLDFRTTRFDPGNDAPYPLWLPTYAATAWYHRRLPAELMAKDLPAVLEEVTRFADRAYRIALAEGDRLEPAVRAAVVAKLARYTGLTEEAVSDSDLRIRPGDFRNALLPGRRSVGRLDSRYVAIDRYGFRTSPDYDPAMAATKGPFAGAMKDYLRGTLRFVMDEPYEILTGRVNPWSYRGYEGRYVSVADRLRRALVKNPDLRVLVMSGSFDLATPHHAIAHTLAHLGLDPALRGNVRTALYRAGHMMYVREEDRRKMKADARAFYE